MTLERYTGGKLHDVAVVRAIGGAALPLTARLRCSIEQGGEECECWG